MSNEDPKCEACGERRSIHVPTDKGPETCPRVARGEGVYEFTGTWSAGLSCSTCGGVCNHHATYRFIPTPSKETL